MDWIVNQFWLLSFFSSFIFFIPLDTITQIIQYLYSFISLRPICFTLINFFSQNFTSTCVYRIKFKWWITSFSLNKIWYAFVFSAVNFCFSLYSIKCFNFIKNFKILNNIKKNYYYETNRFFISTDFSELIHFPCFLKPMKSGALVNIIYLCE